MTIGEALPLRLVLWRHPPQRFANALLVQDGMLLLERLPSTASAAVYEPPGGPIAPGESPDHALEREVRAHLDVEPLAHRLLAVVDACRGDHCCRHWIWAVDHWLGEAHALDDQQLRWTPIERAAGLPGLHPAVAWTLRMLALRGIRL